jgi:hypothetical protein
VIPALLLGVALLAAPAAAGREPASLVLVVASNHGARPGRTTLHYADDDAAKYFEMFSTIADPGGAVLLADFDADTVGLFPRLAAIAGAPVRARLERAAAELAVRSAALAEAGRSVRFYFVFAGHGDVEDGQGFLELSDGRFTAEDLRALVARVGAGETHVILDSCHSFSVVNPRRPGGKRLATSREVADTLGKRLPNVGVVLSTSAQAEVYEWSELQSGVFSHAVRSGLMGAADANGDGAISYSELAAFLDVATVEIKNPLYRPTVFARGPNGEATRAILSPGLARRQTLVIDEPGAVRLAARDANGLRWIDAYKEQGSALRLWLPASLSGGIEIDRLEAGAGRVIASYDLPLGGGSVNLQHLTGSSGAVAMRGAGEIFQGLFARPFGPAAFVAYLERRLGDVVAVGEDEDANAAVPATSAAVASRGAGFEVAALPGSFVPIGDWGGGSSFSAGIRVTRGVNDYVAFGLEASHFATTDRRFFAYPTPYISNPIPGTRLGLRVTPLALDLRVQLPTRPRPYVVVGVGAAVTYVTADPPDFNATLRTTQVQPLVHGGFGVLLDLGTRWSGGVEARYLLLREARPFGARVSLGGVSAAIVTGVRL